MKILHASITFLMVIIICIGIYTASYSQFNLTGASTSYSQFTQVIGQNTTGIIVTQSLNVTVGQTISCQQLALGCSGGAFCATGNFFGLLVPNPICAILCFFNPSNSVCPSQNVIVSNTPKVFNSNAQQVQSVSSNIWLQITSNPLDTALAIMGIFLGLGVLAGLFGAGILARVMASVGIGLSVIVYIEASLTTFGTLPPLIFLGFNGIIGILLLIIAWEAFNTPGAAA